MIWQIHGFAFAFSNGLFVVVALIVVVVIAADVGIVPVADVVTLLELFAKFVDLDFILKWTV